MEELKNYVGKYIRVFSLEYHHNIYYIPYGFFVHASEGISCLYGHNQFVGAMLVNINNKDDFHICIINERSGTIKIVDRNPDDFPYSKYKLMNDIPSNFNLSFLPNEIKDIRVNEVVRYIKRIYSRRMRLIYEVGPELFSKLPMYEISMRRLIRYYLNADKCIYYAQIKE